LGEQQRWISLFHTGLVSQELPDTWADEVWGAEESKKALP
jgi:hypothetical protein